MIGIYQRNASGFLSFNDLDEAKRRRKKRTENNMFKTIMWKSSYAIQ
jgi:hypothetical protein